MSVPAQANLLPHGAARIDFGWISQAWALSSAQRGVWIGMLALSFLINTGVYVLLSIPLDGGGLWTSLKSVYAAVVTHTQTPPVQAVSPYVDFAKTTVWSILLAGFCAIFTGGLFRTALRQKQGERISVFGLFSAFPESIPLFSVGVVVPIVLGLTESAGLWLLHSRLSPSASINAVNQADWIAGIFLNGLLMFAPLLVVDTGASVPEAIFGSVRLLGRQWLRGIGFYLVAAFVGGIGLILCGVGMLATYPVFLLSIATGYLALTQPGAEAAPLFDPAPAGVWPPPPCVPQENQP